MDRSHPQLSPKKSGCVLSVACGSHTHFFAASSPAEARAWVEAITAAWVQVGSALGHLVCTSPCPGSLQGKAACPPVEAGELRMPAPCVQCVKHTARGTHSPTAEEALVLREARWRAQTEALRRSVAEAEQARLRQSTAAWQAAATAVAEVQADDMEASDVQGPAMALGTAGGMQCSKPSCLPKCLPGMSAWS